jgi:hypothetical protein
MSARNAMTDGHERVMLAAVINGKNGGLDLSADDFSSQLNQTIFKAAKSLPRSRRNLLSVQDVLRKRGQLESVGGRAGLTQIACETISPEIVKYSREEILKHSRQRRAAQIGGRLSKGDITPEQAQVQLMELRPPDDAEIDIDAEVDDFPEPPSDAAFHGLAGDIVRRIEPHTEADRAALLIHNLIAYGNAAGRNPHAIADGSRHGMNLFCVCAGESSKSRKGTAQAHTKRLFKRADEDWGKECVTSGLNSGEGLIYTVRDPVTKRVKQKGGGYSTEVVDDGVTDKRRLFVESELSSPLRVMGREGNTLSAVVRAAWDDGDLRTAVKNSPNAATGAHISIIGHVTRDEVRLELNATDQANGFANRFLWLAVRRSKCLPEGGNIDAENLNDLVTRLHRAINFARTAGLITRDDAARELWCACYPALSEGKPGLLGAITARAEAQVLRLSCIYALLDCSTTISVEHHRAALALWNYCERSARWIFGTATGDSNADRIMLALRAAGREGLTRTEIYEDVLQRNVSSKVLAVSLQSLRRNGLATCRKETTSGKPRERWFAKMEAEQ